MNVREKLLADKKALSERIKYIDELLQSIDNEGSSPTQKTTSSKKSNSFPVDKSRFDQVVHIIKTENRFLHNNEISDLILPYWEGKDIAWVRRRISALLSLIKKQTNGGITNIKVNNSLKNTFWGSENWLDLDGETPLKGHEYNKDLVEAPRQKNINF